MLNAVECRVSRPILTALALALLAGCAEAPATELPEEHDSSDAVAVATEEGEDLAALRRLTAGFHDIAAARAAGYTEQITPCWYHRELGGQGNHIARPELIDGSVSLLEPELVMYEPRPNGSMEFLAIEYIVPVDAWEQADPPSLLGRHFHRNDRLGLYVLHVWLGKENPAGLYADWNPNVSCAHAQESEDRA